MRTLLAVVSLILFATLGRDAGAQDETAVHEIRIATLAPRTPVGVRAFRALDDALEERTGGTLDVRVYWGGSMGDESVILEGVDGSEAAESLYSTVHGAGRVMSRSQAAGRVRRRKRWACRVRDCNRVFETNTPCPEHPEAGVSKVWVEEVLRRGVVDWPAVQARLREQGIVLVGGGDMMLAADVIPAD